MRPVGRRRPADKPDIRIPLLGGVQERLVASLSVGRNEVAFVYHHKVERLEDVGLVVDRLNARHDDGLLNIPAVQSCGVDSDGKVWLDRLYLPGVLLDEFLHMGENENAPMPFHDRVLRDLGYAERLAAGRRDDYARVRVLIPKVVVHGLDRVALVRSQVVHGRVLLRWVRASPFGDTLSANRRQGRPLR